MNWFDGLPFRIKTTNMALTGAFPNIIICISEKELIREKSGSFLSWSLACRPAWIVGPGLAPPPCFFCIVLIADNIAECITLMHIVECKVL